MPSHLEVEVEDFREASKEDEKKTQGYTQEEILA